MFGGAHERPTSSWKVGSHLSPGGARKLFDATVLSDVVASTEEAARRGDRAWHGLLDRHDEMVRHRLDRFRGREVKATGDCVPGRL